VSTPPAASALAPRRRRRLFLPFLLLAVLVGTGVVLYVRGTRADDVPRNPASAADGPVAQLYQPPGQPKRVRCAILLNAEADRVWQTVTDYPHYGEFLPYITDATGERTGDGGRVSGQARSLLAGSWPFTITVHEKKADGSRVASWDETGGGEVRVNRGSWEVAPAANGQTLLVLSLEAEVHNYPAFILDGGAPWLWVTCVPLSRGYVSPIFLPDAGPCLACLLGHFERLSPAPEIYADLEEHARQGRPLAPAPFPERGIRILAELAGWKVELLERRPCRRLVGPLPSRGTYPR
jgi:hypothetical protein